MVRFRVFRRLLGAVLTLGAVVSGGLTNVGVRLTVIDTATGAFQRYENPLGAPFQPIQDTAAFATCP